MAFLADAAAHGSATAQHVYGMTMYCNACGRESGAKADFLNAARWIREAAMQGIMEAQYELGEMFRLGLFCKVHMCFARKYIRWASWQGHVEAIVRMKKLRGCVFCGAKTLRSRAHVAAKPDTVTLRARRSIGVRVAAWAWVCAGATLRRTRIPARAHTGGGQTRRGFHDDYFAVFLSYLLCSSPRMMITFISCRQC